MKSNETTELDTVLEIAGRLENRNDDAATAEMLALASQIADQEAVLSGILALKNHGHLAEAARFAEHFEYRGYELPDELSTMTLKEIAESGVVTLQAFDRGERVVFNRLNFRQRRNPSRIRPYKPEYAKSIELSKSDGITVRRLTRERRVNWHEVSSARVDEFEDIFAYGYSQIKYVRRVLEIEVSDAPSLKLDITADRPEFANVEVIEQAIARLIPIAQGERHELPSNYASRRNLWTMAVILAIAAFVIIVDQVLG